MKATLSASLIQAPFVALLLDREGRVIDLNPAAATFFGIAPELARGRLFLSLVDPFSMAKAALMIEQALRDGEVQHWELNHPRPGAPPLLLGYTAWPVRDGQEVIGLVALGLDLGPTIALTAQLAEANQRLEAALKQLERAHADLKAAQAQLVQSEKMRSLGQLVAGVAHEINTPLGYVANNLAFLVERLPALRQTAGDDPVWDDVADAIHESQTGIDRIAEIVRALRSFIRPAETRPVPADVNEGLASTARMVRSISGPRITIREQYQPLPPLVCHPGELNQVFLNLLLNAVQACAGAGEVSISSACDEQQIVITIRDTGIGMDAETLRRLSEPFFTRWPDGHGTGLGLTISRGIVERHGGQITFDSHPGQGTTVTVRLPLPGLSPT